MNTNNAPKITGTDPDANNGKKSKGMRPLVSVDRTTMTVADYLADESMDQHRRSYRWCAANAHRVRPSKDKPAGVRFGIQLADALVTISKRGIEIETRGGARAYRHDGILSGEPLAAALAALDPVEGYQGSVTGDGDVIDLEDLD